ncbi:hypothetical protein MAR_035757 [Mya arenaria]|uniref:Uncharacterized protein n=1 Tax=Mya arenaria TaxID=6604 RepID=A0ABY7EPE7_MYAAR|nr:hypothetical protein MAR_035757 [Mya arenaria]
MQTALHNEIGQTMANVENQELFNGIDKITRHGTRINSAFSDVITLEGITHKVLSAETVTDKDDQIGQRHKLMGEQKKIRNVNDTWHAAKGIVNAMKARTSGFKKNMGITLHVELADKGAAIKNATYHAIWCCHGFQERLRELLDNIVEIIQNVLLKQDEDWKRTLMNAIYKIPDDFVNSVDTHYVESYNNAISIYHDKRITFREKEYRGHICQYATGMKM